MKSYLLLGGPWHGERIELAPSLRGRFEVPVRGPVIKTFSDEQTFPIPDLETLTYVRRDVPLASSGYIGGPFATIMALEGWNHGQITRALAAWINGEDS